MADQLVLAVGNTLRRDDGIAAAVLNSLTRQPNIDYIDGGVDGFSLMDLMANYPTVFLIDAVDMGLAPGSVKIFSPNEAKMIIHSDALSTHGFGLAELLGLMQELAVLPDIKIIGIQPKDISLGEDLSSILQEKLPEIASKIDTILFTRGR